MEHQSLRVLIPKSLDSLLHIEIYDNSSSVRAAFVEREMFQRLSAEWHSTCGFYILFSPISPDGSFKAYVGKATNGFYNRLKDHYATKDWWTNALLVYRDNADKLTSTHSSYLEGRVRDILEALPHVEVTNIAPTGDRTLHDYDREDMEQIATIALRIMALRGYRCPSPSPIVPLTVNNPIVRPMDPSESPTPLLKEQVNTAEATKPFVMLLPEVEELYAILKDWRLRKANAEGNRAFHVFSDNVLKSIANAKPLTEQELLAVRGVAGGKFEKYGNELLVIMNSHR